MMTVDVLEIDFLKETFNHNNSSDIFQNLIIKRFQNYLLKPFCENCFGIISKGIPFKTYVILVVSSGQ